MNETDLEKILNSYITNEYFDYAVMINGQWGSGKTFYFKEYFKKICEEKGFIQLIVSVGGLKHPLDVMQSIGRTYVTTYLVKKKKATEIIDIILSEDVSYFLPDGKIKAGLDGIKTGAQFYSLMKNKFKEKGNDNSKIVLVVDDFERYKGGDYQELLSLIQTRYVDNGVHVLYVADENHIENNEQYFKIKEKYIRHTLRFEPVFESVIGNVIEKRKEINSHSPSVLFFDSDESNISEIFDKKLPLSNVRLVSFSFDCFDEIFKNTDRHLSHMQKVHLLKNILWMVCFYNSEDSIIKNKDENSEYKGFFDYVDRLTGLDNGKLRYIFCKDLKEKLDNSSFSFLRCVRSYVFDGIMDGKEVEDMLNLFYPEENEYVLAYNRLPDVEKLEEDEYACIVNTVISGIKKKEFPFSLLCGVANRLDLAERYLENFHSDTFSELIYSSIKDKDYPGRKEFLERNENYRPHFDSIKYGEIAYNADILLKEECNRYWLEKKRDGFICVFNEINNKPYRELFLSYSGYVFENICKYELFDNLNGLNNNGIYNLKIELTAIKNKSDISQLPYIKQIAEELRGRQFYFTSHMSRTLLGELISSLDGYYEYEQMPKNIEN